MHWTYSRAPSTPPHTPLAATDTLTIGEFDGRTLSSGRMYIAGNDTSGKSILVSDPA